MPADIVVTINKSGMLAAGHAPSTIQEAGQTARRAVLAYYAGLGGSYASWGSQVNLEVTGLNTADEQAGLSMPNPILRHKITGGVIKATNSKYLTIPLSVAAQGVSARNYPGRLIFITSKKGNLLLVTVSGGEITPVYALKESVMQYADPKALPSVTQIEQQVALIVEQTLRTHENV